MLAVTGLLIFLPKAAPRSELRFDWTGFAVLAIGVAALQLMLDRGQKEDWFSSREIVIEAVLTGLGLYLFVAHMFTAKRPFLPPGLFKDRNFVCGVSMVFWDGDCHAGEFRADGALPGEPGGLSGGDRRPVDGAARRRHDDRHAGGEPARQSGGPSQTDGGAALLTLGFALHSMSDWTPDVSQNQMILTFMMQGFAIGFVFNPMTVMAFTTLPPALRGYATSLQSLCRNLGQAVGVSVTSLMLVRSEQTSHADIAGGDHALRSGACRGTTACRTCWIRQRGMVRRCWIR